MVTIAVHEAGHPDRPVSGAVVTVFKGYADDPADFRQPWPPVLDRFITGTEGVGRVALPARAEGPSPALVSVQLPEAWDLVVSPAPLPPEGAWWRRAPVDPRMSLEVARLPDGTLCDAAGRPVTRVQIGLDPSGLHAPRLVAFPAEGVEPEPIEEAHEPARRRGSWGLLAAGAAVAAAALAVALNQRGSSPRASGVAIVAPPETVTAAPVSGVTTTSATAPPFQITSGPATAVGTFSNLQGACPTFPPAFTRTFLITQTGGSIDILQVEAHDAVSGSIGPDGGFDARNDLEEYKGTFTHTAGTAQYTATDLRSHCSGTYTVSFAVRAGG